MNEGSGTTRRTPRHFARYPVGPAGAHLPCGRHILQVMLEIDRSIGQGNRGSGEIDLSRLLSCSQATTALAAVAIVVAGCAGANNTTSSQGEQSHKTMYGISSEGTTTNLYTEFFGSPKPAAAPETTTAAAQPVQPAATSNVPSAQSAAAAQQAQGAAGAKTRQAKPTLPPASTPQAQPAPVEVAQQQTAPQAAHEPDVPTAYGITANGPTTNLYNVFFGRSDRQ